MLTALCILPIYTGSNSNREYSS